MPLMAEDADLTLLDEFLMSDRAPQDCMGLSDLDGFLTGLVVGPELIMPSEWLPQVWGGEGPEFASAAEAEAVLCAIMARYNEIGAQLDRGPDGLEPVFWTGADGETVIAGDWAEGFFEAMNLRPDAWTPLIEDRQAGIILMPILALCSDEDGEALLPLDEEEEKQWQINAPDVIPASVLAIREFWRKRTAEMPFPGVIRTEPKVGRNETCPCGSGRKHKRCCGAN